MAQPANNPIEHTLFTEFAGSGPENTSASYDGPFYPKITSGLMTLDTVDQGLRFLVSGDVWVIDDGAEGVHLAWIRRISQTKGLFELFPE